jgi:hypothetical protein
MESVIKKRQQKKGKLYVLDPDMVSGHENPFEELQ